MARKKKEMEVSMTPDGQKIVSGSVSITRVVDMQVSLSAYGSAKYGEGKYAGEQPRGVSSTDTQEAEPYFKAGMEVELQQFGKPEFSQPLLGEDTDIQQGNISYGLDFKTEAQQKAFHAVQKLLADTDYQGNMEGEERTSIDFKWRGYIPTLSMTYKEFYEAYGLNPAGDGRYHGAQAQEAIEGLKSLMSIRYRLVYDRIVRKDGKPVYRDGKPVKEAIRVTAPIISSVGEAFQDITEEELEQVKAGQEISDRRNTKIIITPSPIMLDRIHEGWYLLKPVRLFSEIQELYAGRRYPEEVSLFIRWILTLDKQTWSIGRKELAYKLKMYSQIKNRRQSLIDKRIREALEVAKELGYLLSYEIQPTGRKPDKLINLKLNPERIRRVKSKMARSQKDEEEAV